MHKAKFLNRNSVIEKLRKIAVRTASRDKNIKKIVLFGSLASDTHTGTSDADLLIILKESSHRMLDRIPDLMLHFVKAPVPVDIIAYTENEVDAIPFAQRAIREGIELT
jgi:predicted nucleotidyltransferase